MLNDLSDVDFIWWCPDCGEPREVCKGECGQRALVDDGGEAAEQPRAADGSDDPQPGTLDYWAAVTSKDAGETRRR